MNGAIPAHIAKTNAGLIEIERLTRHPILATCRPSGFGFLGGRVSGSLPGKDTPAALLESSRAIRTIRGEAARCAIDRFSFLGHATFARLIDWVCSGGTGKPAVA
jgi:hypothetical protein